MCFCFSKLAFSCLPSSLYMSLSNPCQKIRETLQGSALQMEMWNSWVQEMEMWNSWCRWQLSWPCPNPWLSSSLPLTRLRDSLCWERGGQRQLYSFDIAPVSLEGQAASSGKRITELIAAASHNQRTMEPWIMPLFMHTNLSPTHIPCIWNKSHTTKCRAGRKQAFLQWEG